MANERSMNEKVEQRRAEKRGRQDDVEIIEDGFETVRRGHKRANQKIQKLTKKK